jgi:hypothetical protein
VTTEYGQHVFARARKDVEEKGMISTEVHAALEKLGYTLADIAGLENNIKERIFR